MAAGLIIIPNYMPALDSNGRPISGATIQFYRNLTTTAQAVYADYELTTPLTNPVESLSDGKYPAIYGPSDYIYTAVVFDADDVQLTSIDWVAPIAAGDGLFLAGVVGDGGTDDSDALEAQFTAAIAVGNPTIDMVGSAGFNFASIAQITVPAKANLTGMGFSLGLFATDSPGTELTYTGSALVGTNAFVTAGSQVGTPEMNGSLNRLGVNAGGLMPYALRVTDSDAYQLRNVLVKGGTAYQIEVTNTQSGGNVTGYLDFQNVFTYATGPASGLLLNGGGTGADGCTLSAFYNLRAFNYGNGSNEGHGVVFNADGLDNSSFINYTHYTTANTAGKGYGVYMPNQGVDGNTGYVYWGGLCNIGGGFYIGRVGAAVGWTVDLLNDVDRPTHNPVISGPGGGDIAAWSSVSTRRYGPPRVGGYRTINCDDMMEFVDYAAGILRTNSHTYAVTGTGTPAPAASDLGGILVKPSAVTNDTIYLTTTKGNLRKNGKTSAQKLLRAFAIGGGPASGWAFSTHRAGFDGSDTAYSASTLSDAVFVECVSTGAPGTLYLKVRKGGVQTASVACIYHGTDTPVGYATDKLEFVMEITAAHVRLQVRGAGQENFVDCALVEESAGAIIPTVGMSRFASVKVDSADYAASMIFYEDKFAYDIA